MESDVNALGHRTSQVYDAASRRIRLIDANNQGVTFLFDAAGRDRGSIDPLGRRVTLAYDAAGNRTLKLDPRGNRLTATYDAAQRLTGERWQTGKRHTYSYDAVDNRTLVSDPTGVYTSTYDAKNRVAGVLNPNSKRVTYAYDALDRRTRLIDPDNGRFTYAYDAKNRQVGLVNPQGKRATFGYDAADRRTAQRHGNGSRTTHVYDAAGQETVLTNASGSGAVVNRFTYTYDNAGNRIRVQEANGTRTTWAFDATYQLKSEQRNGTNAFNVTYTYDPAGNRTVQLDSGTRTTYSHDSANQLLTELTGSQRTTYLYDNCGNRTQKQAVATTFYNWDETNRLATAEPAAGRVTLSYNADGRRVQKQTATETKKFLYDFEKVLQETDGDDLQTKEYTSTTEQYGELLSAFDHGQSLYFESDALGSTDALLNDSQFATDRYTYRAFGLDTHTGTAGSGSGAALPSALAFPLGSLGGGSSSPGTDRTWVGKQGYVRETETDLYFLGTGGPGGRYYAPDTGGFISEDRTGYAEGPNLYLYAGNNPVNNIDPSGNAFYACQKTRYGDEQGRTRSTVADVLQRAYETTFGPRQAGPFSLDQMDKIPKLRWGEENSIASWLGFGGSDYYKINFFEQLPHQTWEKIRDVPQVKLQPGCNNDAPSVLANIAHLAVTDKYAVAVNQACRGESLFFGLVQQLPANLGLFGLIQQIGHATGDLVTRSIRQAAKLAQVAFVSILRAAGIPTDRFIRYLDWIGDYVEHLMTNGLQIIKNLFGGLKGGVGLFCEGEVGPNAQAAGWASFCPKLPDRLIGGLVEWLGLPETLVTPVKDLFAAFKGGGGLDSFLQPIGQIVLDAVGLGWDQLVKLLNVAVTKEVSPKDVDKSWLVLGIISGLDKVDSGLDKLSGLAELVSEPKKIVEYFEGLVADAQALGGADLGKLLWETIWGAVKSAIPPIAIQALTKFAAKFFGPIGAIIGAVTTIYDFVTLLIEKWNSVLVLITKARTFIQKAVDNDVQGTKVAVSEFLERSIAPALGVLFTLLGANDLPKKVKEAFEKLREQFQAPIKKLFAAAARKLGRLLPAPLRKLIDQDSTGLVVLPVVGKARKNSAEHNSLKLVKKSPTKVIIDVECGGGNRRAGDAEPLLKAMRDEAQKQGAKDLGCYDQLLQKVTSLATAGDQLKSTGAATTTGAQTKTASTETDKVIKAEQSLLDEIEKCCEKLKGGCPTNLKPGGMMCFAAGAMVAQRDGRPDIETLRLADRVNTFRAEERAARQARARTALPRTTAWQAVRLQLPDGAEQVDVELLRTAEWVCENHATVGATLWLDLPHVGVRGQALVIEVTASPTPRKGEGSLVTGTFRHSRRWVYDLRVEGEEKPIGVTATHPFWSADRQDWVPASELRIGERLQAEDGSTPRVVSWTLRAAPEPVYNIEVDGDHCYRVGRQGLLVHNQSFIEEGCDPCETAENQVVTVTGAGGQYRADVDAFKGSGANLKVCRVISISGPLVYAGGGRDPLSGTAQAAMNDLIFGPLGGMNRTKLQIKYRPGTGINTYAAGHCIADSLGGPGNTVNLVPMNTTFNGSGGAWRTTEMYITNCVKDPEVTSASMQVIPVYNEKSQGIDKYVPKKITINVTFRGRGRVTPRSHTFDNSATAALPAWVRNNSPCV